MNRLQTNHYMMVQKRGRPLHTSRRHGRRRGVTFFLVAFMLFFVFLAIAALAVDMGYLYARRAKAQRAADAAALAGAYQMAIGADAKADDSARNYATRNGYDSEVQGVTVTTEHPWKRSNWYHVTVQRTEPVFFAAAFGWRSMEVGASATAQYLRDLPIPIDPQYYGLKDGPVTYSLFGPDGLHSNGDKFSVKLLNNGDENPDYKGTGYNFGITIPSDYAQLNGTSQVQLEIFDPDCHNKDDRLYADAERVDELRGPHSETGGSVTDATTTRYTLIWDRDGNPDNPDPSDHVEIAQQSYGNDLTTDMQWHTPAGFTFDSSLYPTGSFRVNVTSTAGSSENGFSLRAGQPHAVDANGNSVMDETTWHDTLSGSPGTSKAGQVNGTGISALGRLPMNFNINGVADILLGYVPATAQGGTFSITKFDTEVGARSVYYICDTLPGQTFPGVLAANDQTVTDNISIPAGYTGGNWHAIYDAGTNDTSSWILAYGGSGSAIKLVE
jgi:Flp pilus assembly protein TadG